MVLQYVAIHSVAKFVSKGHMVYDHADAPETRSIMNISRETSIEFPGSGSWENSYFAPEDTDNKYC